MFLMKSNDDKRTRQQWLTPGLPYRWRRGYATSLFCARPGQLSVCAVSVDSIPGYKRWGIVCENVLGLTTYE
jgi:hypothetical protein